MSLLKTQSISFISRFTAMILGIVQSLFIVNILTSTEWGAIRIITSIASIVGTSQALGLTSGSTREISQAKSKKEVFKIFFISFLVRLFISLPFILYLFFFSNSLASKSSNPALVSWALRIVAITLLFQSSLGIFNSVLAGLRKFKIIFTYQALIALFSVFVYIPLVYFLRFKGFYYAYLLFNMTSFVILGFLAFKSMGFNFEKTTLTDFKRILRAIFGISLVVYIVKIAFTFWREGPVLFMNYILNSPESLVAIFGFAMFYSTKLMVFSDSITDVTLPEMSKKFGENKEEFKKSYIKNYKQTFLILTSFSAIAASLHYFILPLVIKNPDYYKSFTIIPFTILAIWSYSNLNLFKSSIFIPAKKLMPLVLSYFLMLFVSIILMFFFNFVFPFSNTLVLLALSISLGSLVSYLLSLYLIKKYLNINLIDMYLFIYFIMSIFYVYSCYLSQKFSYIVLLTFFYLLISLYFYKKQGLLKLVYALYKKVFKFNIL